MDKEWARCMVYNSVPFHRFPILMIKEMVTVCVFWLNMFPPHDGVSITLSPPRALMTSFTLDYTSQALSVRVRILREDT
jgi:hypothetical protein